MTLPSLIERLRAVAPVRVEGRANDFALFDMANLNLQDLNLLINEAATALETAREALTDARRYVAGGWIDPVAADALLAKLDEAIALIGEKV